MEDSRITFLPALGQYAIAYTAYTSGGPGMALARTLRLTLVDHVLELACGTGIWTQELMRISLILSNFPLPSRK